MVQHGRAFPPGLEFVAGAADRTRSALALAAVLGVLRAHPRLQVRFRPLNLSFFVDYLADVRDVLQRLVFFLADGRFFGEVTRVQDVVDLRAVVGIVD